MKHKLFSVVTAVILIFCLGISVSAAGAAPFVVDDADLLSQEEELSLGAEAKSLSEYYNFGIYIMTAEDYQDLPGAGSVEDAAATAFLDGDYGAGDDRSGIILLLSMEDRDYAVYYHGDSLGAFSDFGIQYLAQSFLDDFGDDQWYNGFLDYISTSSDMLEAAKNGEPVKEDLSHARIYGIIVCVLLGFIIAFIVKAVLKSQLTSVAEKAEASAFVAQEGLKLSRKSDLFTHRTQTRVYDPPKSSSDDRSSSSSGSGSGKF